MFSDSPAEFPTTAWSMVQGAKKHDGDDYLAAMNRCIKGYWRPVFYFIRTKGYPLHQAEDLTQEFFLQFFQRDWVRRADRERGRFRTFLLTVLVRFLSDRGPKRVPRQELFDRRLVSISTLVGDQERTFEPPARETPEQVFMKKWAQAVIGNVRTHLEAWCRSKNRCEWYDVFSTIHFPSPNDARPTQLGMAERFNMTRDQIRYGLEQTESQFVEFLRAEVAEQVGSVEDIEIEIGELERLLGV